jgi:hypothetical protein
MCTRRGIYEEFIEGWLEGAHQCPAVCDRCPSLEPGPEARGVSVRASWCLRLDRGVDPREACLAFRCVCGQTTITRGQDAPATDAL